MAARHDNFDLCRYERTSFTLFLFFVIFFGLCSQKCKAIAGSQRGLPFICFSQDLAAHLTEINSKSLQAIRLEKNTKYVSNNKSIYLKKIVLRIAIRDSILFIEFIFLPI